MDFSPRADQYRAVSRLYRPTVPQAIVLAASAAAAMGYAMFLRYRVIETSSVALACDAGMQSILCPMRTIATGLMRQSAFGWVAVGAAVLNILRPNVVFTAVSVVAAGLGIVLYNVSLSAFAVALLILSLARRVRAG